MTETITIPKAEYDSLRATLEELNDRIVVHNFMHDPKPGLPAAYIERMIDGESILKLWREHRGITQTQLAQESGVNRVQINNIENQGKSGSPRTLLRLAKALEISINDLILDED